MPVLREAVVLVICQLFTSAEYLLYSALVNYDKSQYAN